jgi:hypothetical protein
LAAKWQDGVAAAVLSARVAAADFMNFNLEQTTQQTTSKRCKYFN